MTPPPYTIQDQQKFLLWSSSNLQDTAYTMQNLIPAKFSTVTVRLQTRTYKLHTPYEQANIHLMQVP